MRLILVFAVLASTAASANEIDQSKKTKSFQIVDMKATVKDHWQMDEGPFDVESYVVEAVNSKESKVTSPVMLRIGFKVNGLTRFDLHPRSGKISFEVSPDLGGYPDILKRKIIPLPLVANQLEVELPPGKYIANVLPDSGEKHPGWVSKFAQFEVVPK